MSILLIEYREENLYSKSMIRKLHHIFSIFVVVSLFFILSVSPTFAFSGSGSGTSGDPYQITTCAQLQEMSTSLSSYYKQMNDIDCTGVTWTAVGTSSTNFSGTLDGQNYTIAHLTISGSSGHNGLFGYTNGASIKNVRLISGSVSDTGNEVGSLIGDATSTTITHSSSQLNVTADGYSGGLVGYGHGSLTIQKSFYSGTITASGADIGGLVGDFNGGSNTVSDCYTTGTIGGSSTIDIGGLIGYSYSGGAITTSNSYSTMTLSAGSSSTDVGGLLGYSSTGSISNSFFAGVISHPGSLVNAVFGFDNATATGIYFDEYLAGTSTCNAGSATCTAVNSGNSTPNYLKK